MRMPSSRKNFTLKLSFSNFKSASSQEESALGCRPQSPAPEGTKALTMPFVKLDTGILRSTLWIDRDLREVFITALLMAEPTEFEEESEQLEIRTLKTTGFVIPPGWYGFVRAAGVGIIDAAKVEAESGFLALEKLGAPDLESRTVEHEGRRMIRVSGGYIILNYMKYRDFDHGAADRMRRLRARRKGDVTSNDVTVTRNITHSREQIAEADTERSKAKLLSTVVIPSWVPLEQWNGFLEMRKRIKAPLTERAQRLSIGELEKLKASGNDPGAVLDQSTMKNWRGLFALNRNGNGRSNQPEPAPYESQSVIRRRELEQRKAQGL